MGYDLEFHFDSSEPYDKRMLVWRLEAAGAQVHPDDHYEGGIHVSFGRYGIFHQASEEKMALGVWLWGRSPRDREGMLDFLRLAEKLGCTLHDPQERIDIHTGNVEAVLAGQKKPARLRTRLLGETQGAESKKNDSNKP